jgi:putative transcriptional regulator
VSLSPQSLRGHFLVAARHLNDPNFFKTVVLIIDHNDEGAMGLVVNRPSSLSVANALSHEFDLSTSMEMVHCGGPVDEKALFILHNCDDDEECCQRTVAPGVLTVGDVEEFHKVLGAVEAGQQHVSYRIFHGCAGWSPEQLEGEIDRGDWLVLPASSDFTFHEDPYELWDVCLASVFRENRILPHTVRNPEWN